MAAGLSARLRWLRHNVLGINRRNQELLLRCNSPRLIALVDHKLRTKTVLAAQGIAVPATYAQCARAGELVALADACDRQPEFVLKPACGAGGEGIVVIAGRDGDQLVKVGGGRLSRRDLLAHAADVLSGAFALGQTHDEVLIEQRLKTDAALAPFCPAGVADLRVLVVWGVPLMAMLRLPTQASEGRANLHVGGIGIGLKLVDGSPVYAVWRDRPVERHPDTHQPLCEVRIPAWRELLELAARAYEAVPLGYLGVDIVIDGSDGPMILELNARPGLSIQLANRCGLRPLLGALAQEQPGAAKQLAAAQRVEFGIALNERYGEG
ncbi:MAG: alpha-L-glutamate ligase-like protein [Deltaproteobacteria bacterium]|nr:alpha-L-glutamate ligase-like protein [Deltaproteobacteria bacterium]